MAHNVAAELGSTGIDNKAIPAQVRGQNLTATHTDSSTNGLELVSFVHVFVVWFWFWLPFCAFLLKLLPAATMSDSISEPLSTATPDTISVDTTDGAARTTSTTATSCTPSTGKAVIFLDVDGVLGTSRCILGTCEEDDPGVLYNGKLELRCVRELARIVRSVPGTVVVLSSTSVHHNAKIDLCVLLANDPQEIVKTILCWQTE